MTSAPVPGRRERKKAATRQALADAALRMFLERGYDQVTVREIADAADVSTTTLMKHFPTKEALVFDREPEVDEALVSAVRDRPEGTSVLEALRAHIHVRATSGIRAEAEPLLRLVRETPALAEYWHKMWMGHEHTLSRVITEETGAPEDDPRCAVLAHFALETAALADRSDDPPRVVDVAFDLLENGWQ
ncbi:TetR family transcriptional regulator [Amycolatopsis rubida]|uniref:TetR family transcriptional regulator n=1 Tax=Amycolatopsis rubida TaxID=112413 RepID=A0ABX0BZH3_9PSEU|nr:MULTISPECIES: TetR/AcrR family transcriptional regulator [Amycolatopsis]MYW93680.1 TetR family transcriptional regulator [Amycolatopsis rubida]NEC58667.1 TetR family transcriptional regulator [Amycolatopsis rubida]OAP21762.1 HTH-type transcriptional regulator RutR [Amycolatopsis sp. M39]